MKFIGYAKISKIRSSGVLHHVMGRGIERRKIFLSDTDRNDFIDRLSALVRDGTMEANAWVLRPIIFICFVKLKIYPYPQVCAEF